MHAGERGAREPYRQSTMCLTQRDRQSQRINCHVDTLSHHTLGPGRSADLAHSFAFVPALLMRAMP